ncbi:hypothetical protein [Kitasatospora sp. NBC_01266]|uniref:hypothetical protein n=1 Tax=Kitasatospora sp. NBC_01266 TaxID=2903572 RepID=UPI002E335666|nr:hypothetical protein [Kitasatospora sp. NBC_01266]
MQNKKSTGKRRVATVIATLGMAAGLTMMVGGTANASAFGDGSPDAWQSGQVGYTLGCQLSHALFHTTFSCK